MAAETGKGKGGLLTTMIVVLLLSLMGAGVGFAVGVFLQTEPSKEAKNSPATDETFAKKEVAEGDSGSHGGKPAEDKQEETEEGEETAIEDLAKDLKIVPIPAVLTTLSEPAGKWIRLEGSILAAPGEKTPELLAEQAGEQILAYLRTLRLEQLRSASGFLALRDDLNENVKTLSGGQVHSILIHGLLVE